MPFKPDTVSTGQQNTMKRMALLKKIEACKKAKRGWSPHYMEGYYQSLLLDAQIASLTKELEELYDPRRKPVREP